MKPVINWTLRSRRWSLLWWSIGIIAFVALELSVYPSVKNQAQQLNELLDKLPNTVRSLFGADDLFSPVGYLNSGLFYLLLPLFFSILAIGLGSSLIAREESDRTIELLLSRPISRGKLMLSKLLGGLSISLIIAAVSAIAIMIAVKAVSMAMPLPRVLFATFMALLISLTFGMVAFAITCLGGRGRGAAIGAASLFAIRGYVVSSLESSVHWLTWPAKIFPYHCYNPSTVLNGEYTWLTACWFIFGILILGILSWLAFRNRDIG